MDTNSPPPAGPPAPDPAPPRPSGTDSFFDGIRRSGLVRTEDRWIGGVAGGVARRLGIDPLVVRGVLAVTVLLGGLGLVLYGLGWAFLPEERDGRIHLQQLFRGDFDIAVLGAFVVFATGLSFPERWNPGMWWGGGWWGGSWWSALLWLSAVAVVVVLIVSSNKGGTGTGPTTTLRPTDPPAGPGGTGPGAPPRQPTTTPEGHPMPPAPPHPTTPYPVPPPPTGQQPTAQYAAAPYGTAPYPTAQYPTAQYLTGPYPTAQSPTAQHPGGGPAATAYPAGAPAGGPGRGGPGGPAGPSPGGPAGPGPGTTLPRKPGGPGAGTVGVVAALGLIAFAVLMYADRVGDFSGPVLLTAGAVTMVLIGVGIIVAGLRGRTSGSLGGLAVVGAIVLTPLLVFQQSTVAWNGYGTALGDLVQTPRTIAEAEEGYSLGAGEARIDLTELPASSDPVQVPISVGAGDVTVVMPPDGAYSADIRVMAGEIDWLGERLSRAGVGRADGYESPAVADGAEPEIELDITVGAGTARVVED